MERSNWSKATCPGLQTNMPVTGIDPDYESKTLTTRPRCPSIKQFNALFLSFFCIVNHCFSWISGHWAEVTNHATNDTEWRHNHLDWRMTVKDYLFKLQSIHQENWTGGKAIWFWFIPYLTCLTRRTTVHVVDRNTDFFLIYVDICPQRQNWNSVN